MHSAIRNVLSDVFPPEETLGQVDTDNCGSGWMALRGQQMQVEGVSYRHELLRV